MWRGPTRRKSLIRSSLLLQQCPACFVRLMRMVLEMGSRWLYNFCFVGCCFQDLFNIARSILVQLALSFSSIHLVSVHVVHPYSRINTTVAWENCVLFYRICLTSLGPIIYRYLSMPSLFAYWFNFPWMRRCFQGMWICPLVSGNLRLVWRYLLFDFDWSTWTLLCLHWQGCLCRMLPSPDDSVGIGSGECICQKRLR